MSVQAYNRKIIGTGSSFTELAQEKVQCVLCGSEVQQQHTKVPKSASMEGKSGVPFISRDIITYLLRATI
jgi:hypothetical protein